MERFKYYKRGKGELDTSNFPAIAGDRAVLVDRLDEKTFMSLLALNRFLETELGTQTKVYVKGYVAHMRSDKDEFSPACLYDLLTMLDIQCLQVQHESTEKIKSACVLTEQIARALKFELDQEDDLFFLGADGSVSKFCPDINLMASKVRQAGKVIRVDVDVYAIPEAAEIVVVDDILGGGATIDMLLEHLPDHKKHLWVQYNEGIHPIDFLAKFDRVHLGDTI